MRSRCAGYEDPPIVPESGEMRPMAPAVLAFEDGPVRFKAALMSNAGARSVK